MPKLYGTGPYGKGNYSALTTSNVTAAQGSYAETGEAANLKWQAVTPAAFRFFGCIGQSVILAVQFITVTTQGAFALTGEAATLTWQAIVAAAQGSYILTGFAAGLNSLGWAVATGSYTLTGQAIDFLFGSLWTPETDGSASWVPQVPAADPWLSVATPSASWTDQTPASDPWTPVVPGSPNWTPNP